jgi:hypothetical protein
VRLLLCRRKKEDAAEEARLAQEQDRLRLQFSEEQAKQRAKQAEQQASSSTLPVDCTTRARMGRYRGRPGVAPAACCRVCQRFACLAACLWL